MEQDVGANGRLSKPGFWNVMTGWGVWALLVGVSFFLFIFAFSGNNPDNQQIASDNLSDEERIAELEHRIAILENFTNVNTFGSDPRGTFYTSRMPLWRQCVDGKQTGDPLAYAWVVVDNRFMIKIPEDTLAYKNGTVYECRGSLVK